MRLLERYLRRIAREEAEAAIRRDFNERAKEQHLQTLWDDLQTARKERNALRARILELESGRA